MVVTVFSLLFVYYCVTAFPSYSVALPTMSGRNRGAPGHNETSPGLHRECTNANRCITDTDRDQFCSKLGQICSIA